MRFLVDAQLPPVLGHLFVATGHSYEHVAQVALIRGDDIGVWRYATQHACVIVSKDEDFPTLKALDPSGPQVVWLRVGNCSNRALSRELLEARLSESFSSQRPRIDTPN